MFGLPRSGSLRTVNGVPEIGQAPEGVQLPPDALGAPEGGQPPLPEPARGNVGDYVLYHQKGQIDADAEIAGEANAAGEFLLDVYPEPGNPERKYQVLARPGTEPGCFEG